MIFWKDIMFPIILALLALFLILFVINLVLRFFGLDIPILRFILLLAIWYYVGPEIYNWLSYAIITTQYEGIRILYMPIQSIIEAFESLV